MPQRPDSLTVSSKAQIRALHDTSFLTAFHEPICPSHVAQRLNMPANLVHYRARRYEELGLLRRLGRDGKRVLYELAADSFAYPAHMMMSDDPGNATQQVLRRLHNGLLNIDTDTSSGSQMVRVVFREEPHMEEKVPGSIRVKTLILTQERQRRLMARLEDVIREFSDDKMGERYTLALIHFKGDIND